MSISVWSGSCAATSASWLCGRACECTSAASSRSGDGHFLPVGAGWPGGVQYGDCIMYWYSPTRQSPRTPPPFQSMRGWKESCTQSGSSDCSLVVHDSRLHGGGGELSTPASAKPAGTLSATF